jgi:signal transduction histidine kinase
MDTQNEICRRYEAAMAAIASADRAYYLKEKPTPADRRAYAERKTQLQDLRTELYAELSARGAKKPSRPETFTVSLEDRALNQHISSEEMCSIMHNLRNYLAVALGRTELLEETIEADPQAKKHLAAILDSVNKITLCLRQPCPRRSTRQIC